MRYLQALAALLFASLASAQVSLVCTASCPTSYYWEEVACSGGVCTRPLPTATELKTMSLATTSTTSGWSTILCAEAGQGLTGDGTLQAYAWVPWLPTTLVRSTWLDVLLSDVISATDCSGGPCPCASLPDAVVGPAAARRILYMPASVGVTGGSYVRVYHYSG